MIKIIPLILKICEKDCTFSRLPILELDSLNRRPLKPWQSTQAAFYGISAYSPPGVNVPKIRYLMTIS
jgi:hypothetical protein